MAEGLVGFSNPKRKENHMEHRCHWSGRGSVLMGLSLGGRVTRIQKDVGCSRWSCAGDIECPGHDQLYLSGCSDPYYDGVHTVPSGECDDIDT